ncbi:MAG: hypothetical protein NTV88_01940 [Candidatus Micrarchaeota archaeon]|nr:hypothetical protein [Candidatus Micrarchaeota archaeon]
MTCKIYVETTVIVCSSLGVKIGGKQVKHDKYDTTYNFLLYAERGYEKGTDSFYTTSTAVIESQRVLEIALNTMLENQLPSLSRKNIQRRRQAADTFYELLNDCLDQMEIWVSYLKQETFDSRKKDEMINTLREEFRKLDVDFRSEYGAEIDDFHFNLRRSVRGVAKAVRTIQHREAYKTYKPKPGRADIEIMAEVAAINSGCPDDIYIVGEDGHFCAEKNRALLERLFKIKCRYSTEMLDGLIRSLLPS